MPPATAPPRLEQRIVTIRGETAGYLAGGAGEPLVFVHGLSGSTRWWARNAPHLARHYAVYVVNLPGFGQLSWRRSRFVLREAADWLADWLAAVGIERCHLVGHSMGGFIAIGVATRHPTLVRSLALVAPAGVPTGRTFVGHGIPLIAAGLVAAPSFLPTLVFDALRAGPRTLLRAARDLLTEDVRSELRAISQPTLLVWGDRDTLVPPSLAPAMLSELPHGRLALVRGAGHVPMYDRPRAFNEALLNFLRGEDAERWDSEREV